MTNNNSTIQNVKDLILTEAKLEDILKENDSLRKENEELKLKVKYRPTFITV